MSLLAQAWRSAALYGALSIAMIYAALALTTEPAYATTCTTTFCQNSAPNLCRTVCMAKYHDGVSQVVCPEPGNNSEYQCYCQLAGQLIANIPCM